MTQIELIFTNFFSIFTKPAKFVCDFTKKCFIFAFPFFETGKIELN